jgi:hypothetical protein
MLLPAHIGGVPEARDYYFSFVDSLITRLVTALG